MVEVEKRIFDAAKSNLVHLVETTRALSFKVGADQLQFQQLLESDENKHRLAYFFLRKLDFLINPLLTEITHVQRGDLDANFVLTSKYFSWLTWTVRQALAESSEKDNTYGSLVRSCQYLLEDYLKKNQKGKQEIVHFSEQVYLVISRIRSDFLPDEVIIQPTKETADCFEPVELFIKEYKRQIESEDFKTRVAISQIQQKFAQKKADEIAFDAERSALTFQGKSIEISKSKNSDPHYLLAVVFKDKSKVWAYDEIWDDMYFQRMHQKYDPKKDWRKIYNAAYSVNEKVAKATTVADFLDISKTEVSINKAYL